MIDASSAPPAARPLTLRPAGIADAALIADMHAKSRASAYRGLLPDDYLDGGVRIEVLATWPPKMQALAAGAGAALIAERDGTPIGFICMLTRDDKDSVLIDNLHLLPEHKGGGAGTAMLDAAQRWAAVRGANSLELLVLESNVAAIGFYEARGWQLAGREDDAMGGVNVVALRYVLPITLPKTIS